MTDSIGDQIARLQAQIAELRGDTATLAAQLDREDALDYVVTKTGLTGLLAIRQRGTGADATYTLLFDTGEEIRVGDAGALLSQATLDKLLFPTGRALPTIKRADWKAVTVAMLAIREIIEVQGERFEDALAEWIEGYAAHATRTDRDGAIAARQPFIEDGRLHIFASGLAKYIRREYSEQVREPELRQGLAELGYVWAKLNYRKPDGSRSSSGYYVQAQSETPAEAA